MKLVPSCPGVHRIASHHWNETCYWATSQPQASRKMISLLFIHTRSHKKLLVKPIHRISHQLKYSPYYTTETVSHLFTYLYSLVALYGDGFLENTKIVLVSSQRERVSVCVFLKEYCVRDKNHHVAVDYS